MISRMFFMAWFKYLSGFSSGPYAGNKIFQLDSRFQQSIFLQPYYYKQDVHPVLKVFSVWILRLIFLKDRQTPMS